MKSDSIAHKNVPSTSADMPRQLTTCSHESKHIRANPQRVVPTPSRKAFPVSTVFLTLLFLLLPSVTLCRGPKNDFGLVSDTHECVPITMGLCRDIGYNATVFPNLVGIDNQREAEEQLATYQPLINIGCSSQLQFFLCSVYAPMCTEKIDRKIGPCRPLCENVKKRCEPMLLQFGFEWPPLLNCEQFLSDNNNENMCMVGPGEKPPKNQPPPAKGPSGANAAPPGYPPGYPSPNAGGASAAPSCPMSGGSLVYLNSTGRCAGRCEPGVPFSQSQRKATEVWMGCLAGTCIILSVGAVLLIIFSSSYPSPSGKIRYPERPLLFIACSYCLVSIGYAIRLFSGFAGSACASYSVGNVPGSSSGGGGLLASVLVLPRSSNLRCTAVFLTTYYGAMAATAWWLVLAGCWAAAAGLGVSPDDIGRRATLFHIPAWGAPGLLAIAVLVRQSVEGDPLSGLCGVGGGPVGPAGRLVMTAGGSIAMPSDSELLHFVIIPHVVALVIGMAFLTAGAVGALCCCSNSGPWGSGSRPWRRNERQGASPGGDGSKLLDGNTPVGSGHKASSGMLMTPYSNAQQQNLHLLQQGPSGNPSLGNMGSPYSHGVVGGVASPGLIAGGASPGKPDPRSGQGCLLRLGALAFFYLVPATCLLAAYFYEWSNRHYWYLGPDPIRPPHSYFGTQMARLQGPNGHVGAQVEPSSSSKYVSQFYDSVSAQIFSDQQNLLTRSSNLGVLGGTNGQRGGGPVSMGQAGFGLTQTPSFETFILKIAATLLFGITVAAWLLIRILCHYGCGGPSFSKAPQLQQPLPLQQGWSVPRSSPNGPNGVPMCAPIGANYPNVGYNQATGCAFTGSKLTPLQTQQQIYMQQQQHHPQSQPQISYAYKGPDNTYNSSGLGTNTNYAHNTPVFNNSANSPDQLFQQQQQSSSMYPRPYSPSDASNNPYHHPLDTSNNMFMQQRDHNVI